MAAAKKEVKGTTFREFLKRSNSQIKDDRADRIGKSVTMSYEALVNKKKKELFEIEDQLELMTDISAGNSSTSLNTVRDFDGDAFVEKRAKLLAEQTILELKLKVLLDDASFYGV